MWLCVDRIEKDTVILIGDDERVYPLSRADYTALVGFSPVESAILAAEIRDGRIVSAAYDEAETAARMAAARARLDRLFGKQ
jgi:hypothetical protein